MNALRCVFAAALLVVIPARAEDDFPGAKDHPLFTRMPGHHIDNYRSSAFDGYEFHGKGRAMVRVEGRFTRIGYRPNDGVTVPSPLQTARNHQNAITKIGGAVLHQEVGPGGGQTTMNLVKDGAELWAELSIGDGGNNYTLTIVEKGSMKQEVTASAEAWKSDLSRTGHAAVYGILFDTGKAEVKPESRPALEEIARLLARNPSLNLFVVGHTDGTGSAETNQRLSQARAESVVRALTASHGVSATRLRPQGVGPYAPVATNDTEDGRAKNRRVELVKQ